MLWVPGLPQQPKTAFLSLHLGKVDSKPVKLENSIVPIDHKPLRNDFRALIENIFSTKTPGKVQKLR